MSVEVIFLANFVKLMAVIFLLVFTIKLFLISRGSDWDGWNIMTIGITLLSITSLLHMLKIFGIYLETVRAVLSAVGGIITLAAFIMATKIIKKG